MDTPYFVPVIGCENMYYVDFPSIQKMENKPMDKKSGIYQITNKADGKKYVGATVNFSARWRMHLSDLKRRRHANKNLQSAFNEHGQDCFIFSVLEVCEKNLLLDRERFYIRTLKPEYNSVPRAFEDGILTID
jgi:group I intron endonuclease